LTRLNTAVFAPMPSPSVRTTAAVTPRVWSSCRVAVWPGRRSGAIINWPVRHRCPVCSYLPDASRPCVHRAPAGQHQRKRICSGKGRGGGGDNHRRGPSRRGEHDLRPIRAARCANPAVERRVGDRRREPLGRGFGGCESAQGRINASGRVAGWLALGRSAAGPARAEQRALRARPSPPNGSVVATGPPHAGGRGRSLHVDHRWLALADPAATPRRREQARRTQPVGAANGRRSDSFLRP
jgi:hypothetical protein